MCSTIAVILNPASGKEECLPNDLAAILRDSGLNAEIIVPGQGEDVDTLARRLADNGYGMIVAAGGDGTVGSVASALVGSRIPLGVLPMGTFNNLAHDLRLPMELPDAVQVLAHGRVETIDAAEVNGHVFVNNSSLGLYPRIVEDREQQRIHFARPKWLAMLRATIAAIRNLSFMKARIKITQRHEERSVDDEASECLSGELVRRTPILFVGNNSYQFEGPSLGRRAHLDCGTLTVLVAHPKGRWGLLRLALRALFGRLRGDRDLVAFMAEKLEVHLPQSHVRVALDGEVLSLKPPLRYRSIPRGLRVVVPMESTDTTKQNPR